MTLSKAIPLTKGLLGPHQAEGKGDAPRLLLQHLGHLVVATAHNALVIDGLDVIADAHRLQAVDGAAFLYPLKKKHRGRWQDRFIAQCHNGALSHRGKLTNKAETYLRLTDSCLALAHLNEGVSGAIVCDCESQRILRLGHLHLLRLPADVSEDEVLQSDLSPEKLLHVHLVRVEGAKQDLQGEQGE